MAVTGWPADFATAALAMAPYTGSQHAPALRIADESALLELNTTVAGVSILDGGEMAGVHAEIRELARGGISVSYAGSGSYIIEYDAAVKGSYDAVI